MKRKTFEFQNSEGKTITLRLRPSKEIPEKYLFSKYQSNRFIKELDFNHGDALIVSLNADDLEIFYSEPIINLTIGFKSIDEDTLNDNDDNKSRLYV